ncbi:MAG: glycosyltransferase family 2 protein [Acidobacteria bacterium]|nr:glycosyltransferase family 2 protein [Acidobacteriota bacterium]
MKKRLTLQVQTSIVFIIFNRPDTAAKVFAEIRRARPQKLFVIADAPRVSQKGEREKCLAARAIIEAVDWECEVFTNFAESNLGCQRRISSGLDWVFDQVEEAIVLEDDCVPHPSFFPFCEELLDRYREDRRVMHIAGTNYQFGRQRFPYSYYFSRYNHCTGWATWRSAWRHFDVEMKLWPEFRDRNLLKDLFDDAQAEAYWHRSFQMVYEKRIDSWAYCWTLACWIQNGLTILPNVNLICNIGFDANGSHTKNRRSRFANIPLEEMKFPLQHPPFVVRDDQADRFTQDNNFKRSLIARVGSQLLHAAAAMKAKQ